MEVHLLNILTEVKKRLTILPKNQIQVIQNLLSVGTELHGRKTVIIRCIILRIQLMSSADFQLRRYLKQISLMISKLKAIRIR